MGVTTDWVNDPSSLHAKSGVLMSGLAITPGSRTAWYFSDDIDQTSRWFHNSDDILAEFKNGWMEYELTQMHSWFPDARV